MDIIPAIMPESLEDMRQKMAYVIDVVNLVQLDIMDGKFVQETTFPFFERDALDMEYIMSQDEALQYWERLDVELDLMVENAHQNFDMFIALGPKRIIFHLEAEGDLNEFKDFLEGIDMYTHENVEIGIATNNDTSVEALFSFIPLVSFVQCMGIARIGYQGEPFDERVIERIKILREKFPGLIISVDGAVNINTIKALKEAGADRLVVGSAIFESGDAEESIEELESMI